MEMQPLIIVCGVYFSGAEIGTIKSLVGSPEAISDILLRVIMIIFPVTPVSGHQ
jgi:hypothetical protein